MPQRDEKEQLEAFRRVVETADLANALTEPLVSSIETLLRVTAAELGSSEASVLIRDGDNGDLRFLSAIGPVAEQLIDLRVPGGKGIAGFVLSSGQPMAVADVGTASNFYAEIDKTTGYSTQMILATPLRHNDDVIGVLEYINRAGNPPYAPFTPAEMDKAANYADVVASMVNAYESAKLFRDFGGRAAAGEASADAVSLRTWLQDVRAAPQYREMMELAALIRDTVGAGEAERRLCREILESVIRFAELKNDSTYLTY